MVQLVIAFIILIAAAVLAGRVSRVKPRSLGYGQASESDQQRAAKSIRSLSFAIALGGVAVAAIVAATSCVYSLDVGEVAVIRNLGGSVSGSQSEAGFHTKAPWQSAVKYDTRNNLVNFYGDTDYETTGGSEVGKQVSINDKSGASANIDIQVNYSLRPNAAVSLYRDYGSQENFVSKYISNDLRSVTREIAGKYDTITMLTDRGSFTRGVQKALSEKWKGMGLTVEQVSVQDVRYPKEITSAYAAAQAAEVQKRKASNEQETAKVEAETKRIKAQGEADANDILNSSLSENVLRQKYIDALSNAKNLTVVPDGSVPMVQTK